MQSRGTPATGSARFSLAPPFHPSSFPPAAQKIPMTPSLFAPPSPSFSSRRDFLCKAGNGFGALALAGLLAQDGRLARAATGTPLNPLAPRAGHFPGKAKSVIWLFMNGGPSQFNTVE